MEEEDAEESVPFGTENSKYWAQRYELWEKYDEGIKMDKEGWYSVTPEVIAAHIAKRFVEKLGPNALVIDAMAGVGGNSIQFALHFPIAFGIDLSLERLLLAKHNAKVYGVQNLELMRGDFTCIAPHWRTADAVFLSPPWGGPDYQQQTIFDISTMTPSGEALFEVSRALTSNIAFLLPRQTSILQLTDLARKAKQQQKRHNKNEAVEVEETYLNDRLKMMTVYYGALVNQTTDPNAEEENNVEEIVEQTKCTDNNDQSISNNEEQTPSNQKKRRRSRRKSGNKKQRTDTT